MESRKPYKSLLWGTFEQQQDASAEFLQPHPSAQLPFGQFVRNRRRTACVLLGGLLAIVAINMGRPWYALMYLTGWCYLASAACFFLLWMAHQFNGDYNEGKDEYEPPSKPIAPF